jgi:hypothetical protein
MPMKQQTFDSAGPDIRVRGNAYQVWEKYLGLARDAQSAGDRIAAENFFQHAEHYYRIMNANGGDPATYNGRPRFNPRDENGFDEDGQPLPGGGPQPSAEPQQPRQADSRPADGRPDARTENRPAENRPADLRQGGEGRQEERRSEGRQSERGEREARPRDLRTRPQPDQPTNGTNGTGGGSEEPSGT